MEKTRKEYEFCRRCGRRLKNPAARVLGYGATCYKKVQYEDAHPLFYTETSGAGGRYMLRS